MVKARGSLPATPETAAGVRWPDAPCSSVGSAQGSSRVEWGSHCHSTGPRGAGSGFRSSRVHLWLQPPYATFYWARKYRLAALPGALPGHAAQMQRINLTDAPRLPPSCTGSGAGVAGRLLLARWVLHFSHSL